VSLVSAFAKAAARLGGAKTQRQAERPTRNGS
jgi:hypothetical protein